jgi:hypothetical protein
MYIFCVVNKTTCLPEVAHVEPGAENAHQLIFVVVNVSLHNVHARSHQTLKRLHVQNCREMKSINGIKLSLLFKKKLTGETNGTDTIGGGGSRSMGDERQFSNVSALGDPTDLDLNFIFSGDGDANGARLDKVHAVGRVALPDDAFAIFKCPRIERIRHVHPLVRLHQKKGASHHPLVVTL